MFIPLAYADEQWDTVSIFDQSNSTQYLFHYSVKNSTFVFIQPYDSVPFPLPSFTFDTSKNMDGYLKFKVPKNYPFYSTMEPFTVSVSDYQENSYSLAHLVENDFSNDCFYEIDLFVGNLTIVEFTSFLPLVPYWTFESQNVPAECLLQTIAGYEAFSDDDWKIYESSVNLSDSSQSFNIPYQLHGGTIDTIQIDQKATSFLMVLKNNTGNELKIVIPRNLFDAKSSIEMDRPFFVLVDGLKAHYIETKNQCSRNLSIPINTDSKLVEIIDNNNAENPKKSIPTLYVETDKDHYSDGQTIVVNGCVSLSSEAGDVSIDILDSYGQVYHNFLVHPNEDGTFSASFVINDTSVDAQYTVRAEYEGHVTVNTFTVPEFPTAYLVLFVAVVSIILFTKKGGHVLHKSNI